MHANLDPSGAEFASPQFKGDTGTSDLAASGKPVCAPSSGGAGSGSVGGHSSDLKMEVRRGRLWLRPALAFDWGNNDKDRKVDWSELFSDLVVVVVAMRVSAAMEAEFSASTLAVVSSQFFLVQRSWMLLANYVSRFATNDLAYKIANVSAVCHARFDVTCVRVEFRVSRFCVCVTVPGKIVESRVSRPFWLL